MKARSKGFGFILVLLGIMLVGRTTGLFDFDLGDIIESTWPVGLIALGLWLIARKKKSLARAESDPYSCQDREPDLASIRVDISGTTAESYTPPPQAEPAADPPGSTSGFSRERAQKGPGGRLKYNKLLGEMTIDCANLSLEDIEVSHGIGDVEILLSGGILSDGLNRLIFSGFIGDVRIFAPKDMSVSACCSNFIGDIAAGNRKTSGFGNNIEWQTDKYTSASSKLYIAANCFIGDIKIYMV